ncbi:MAG: endopeptidase La [Lachnospiraceae bacterium]|nr:endopeptidase La [Lachnospiraceae bacterium]
MEENINTDTAEKNPARKLPCVALRNLVILPNVLIHFDISGDRALSAVDAAMLENQEIFITAVQNYSVEDPGKDDLYKMGTLSKIRQVIKMPGHIVRIMVEAVERAEVVRFSKKKEYFHVQIRTFPKEKAQDVSAEEAEAMRREIEELFSEFVSFFPRIGKAVGRQFSEIPDLGDLMDAVIANMPLDFEHKQEVLERVSYKDRFAKVREILAQEIDIARIRSDFAEKVRGRVDQEQRDYFLREQLRYIREELGDKVPENEADKYQQMCDKLDAPKEVKEKIYKEIERFRNIPMGSSESGVDQIHIETLLEIPWNKLSTDNKSLEHAENVLERDHYGLEKVKERMIEFLAVKNLTEKGQSPIILLVGPPGTGKTSIAKSIADALGRKYIRISLGGVRDEAEIRGHRKTYVGAMPGVIATGLQQAGVRNPLILLDEVDKLSSDYHGATSSALLEVLDAEQNKHFRDHYIEAPLDLSDVLFIATANSTQGIPVPLLDRMEVVEVSGYTQNEKFHIAKEHLIRKQLKKNGLKSSQLKISDDGINAIIDLYTREAGVRKLERRIGELCRKTAKIVYKGEKKSLKVTAKNLEEYLGKPKYLPEDELGEDAVGIVRGLAWTSVGGTTLEIEVNIMPGKGALVLTGQLGDVMKESARAGLSYVRSVSPVYGIPESFYRNHDFHIHIPEGAVPKDGPSAGITMATALFSAVTGSKVKATVAMTGEITLRGRVLPIGGLKEKILAAKNAHIKTVLVPEKNRRDVEEISEEIKEGINILYMESMDQVLSEALTELPAKAQPDSSKKKRSKKGKTDGHKEG